ncbi:MAG: bifunctional riboflavin kinase/FAD synthetase [Selenomonadaceae bacterium]|nr:bifunctional riboflavin kinase/FAD synthetase [Selenomonadaceae bacterium]MBQ1509306.1 bifunctional riboflavin kinase/FAD synthetase [Selenomonadaceae bacterium]
MKTYTKITDITKEYPRISVALGMFDGMHIGHQSIVQRAMELAKEQNGTSAVFTFNNHPLSILAKDRMPLQIGSPELRASILEKMGVEVLFNIPFTKEFSKLSPEKFLELLRNNLAPKYVVTGANFTFGRQGKGNQRLLQRVGEDYGFHAEICPTVLAGGHPVSSTRIRELLKEGDLDRVNEFLGRPFVFTARVIHGDRRGRTLGFPTANLQISESRAMLPNGAYAVQVIYKGTCYDGLANIGNNPTFEGNNRRLEVNIQEFRENIYDQLLQVVFLEKLREEKKFPSVEHLVRQLHNDRENARKIWDKYRP